MRHRNLLLILIAALFVFRAAYILYTPLDISPDEAHYWEWSRRLDLSYYSKGPAVACVIAFFTKVFGDTPFGVRIGAPVASALATVMMYLLGKELFRSERVGFYSALLPNVTPIFSVGSILMTTDILLVLFWASAVYAFKRAADGSRAWWILTGAFLGAGFLSKYTIALLGPGFLAFLIISKGARRWLLTPWPYAAGLVALALSAPVILWNIDHGQVTIRHTMGQAHLGEGAFSIAPAIEFVLSQAGLLTPFIFAGTVYGVSRCAKEAFSRRDGAYLLVALTSVPLFLFFLFKAFHGKVQANWAVASFVTAFPASVWALDGLYGRVGGKLLKAVFFTGIAIGVLATFAAYFPWTLEAAGFKRIMWGAPYNRVTGWKELGERVSQIKAGMDRHGETFIISDTYQTASELAFYTEGKPVTYNVNAGTRRMNQYDLWPGFEDRKGQNAIYVRGGVSRAEMVEDGFERCEREILAVPRDGRILKEFSIFRCYGYRGGLDREIKDRY